MAETITGNKLNTSDSKKKRYFDLNLMFITGFLCVFGLIMIYSATGGDTGTMFKQGIIMLVAVFITVIAMMLPFNGFMKLSIALYVFAAILVCLVKVPALGHASHGATRWLYLGPISIQPAEIAKLAIIIYAATIITRFRKKITDKKVALIIFAPTLFMSGLVFILTQNLSSAFIIMFIVIIMYFSLHPNWSVFLIIAGVAAAIVAVIVFWVKSMDVTDEMINNAGSFRIERIISWLHVEKFTDDQSMQTMNALYAIGSGGLFGKGLGSSIQKYNIPEVHNDMIFAVICEELGLFGAFVLILLFILLLYRIVFIARNTMNTFAGIVSLGVFAHIATQVILNIGVVTNVFPNTGVTLPFISYGGSAVAVLIFEIGLVLKSSRHIPVEQ